jgi:hypothetical protein
MNKLILGSLAGSLLLAATLPVFADQVQTTTETIQSPPQVIDSYMKPTVTQTKTVTENDGTVHTSTAPMVMERHEQVVMPTTQVQTTTTTTDPKIITEQTTKRVSHIAARPHRIVKRCVAHKPRRHVVAYRHRTGKRAVAYNVRKTTIVEPQVIQQTQTIHQSTGAVIDRKDPALEQF